MNKKKQLRTWLEIGVGRGTALAKAMGVSRQFIHSSSQGKTGISDHQWSAITFAMNIVELDEMRSQKSIEQNIVKAARNSHNKDSEVKNMSLVELDKWVDVLGRVA
ncbi:hypothetical protein SDC64_07490 [Acinetobacter haemolyticus]|uniref:hypothetical protein n=1 Tax=Acinetobacter haemolyticus TaxID=29430 RepID=UPI000F75F454|nr:hypothetical protein [Acinetobacter haemolyticus]AZN67038.1 hypothetical protein DX910_00615 [Acinetobacter haemolyticus]WPO68753.1 hypothetical protein SDC64_07490 [Acinetobacter haemolyticus]